MHRLGGSVKKFTERKQKLEQEDDKEDDNTENLKTRSCEEDSKSIKDIFNTNSCWPRTYMIY